MSMTRSRDRVEIQFESVGRGDPALIFVHGWSCDRTYWRGQVDYFARSHRVVSIDLGGHGESGLGRHEWTIEAYGEDVCAVIEALNFNSVNLIGHSSGAMVIIEAHRHILDRVRGLVAVEYFENADFQMTAEEIEAQAAPMRADFRRTAGELVRGYFPATADPALVEWIAADMASAPPDVAISALQHARRYNKGRGLSSVGVPMSIINTDFWPTNIQAAQRYKPDLQLTTLPGLGHFPMLEDPVAFNHALSNAIAHMI